jgi:hypothetical protein
MSFQPFGARISRRWPCAEPVAARRPRLTPEHDQHNRRDRGYEGDQIPPPASVDIVQPSNSYGKSGEQKNKPRQRGENACAGRGVDEDRSQSDEKPK